MKAACDYSSAYCILQTDNPAFSGHGVMFTIGRGNDIVCSAIRYPPWTRSLTEDWCATRRYLVNDSHLRWIRPEKGVIHLVLVLGMPVWRIVSEMIPEEFVRCIDLRYITDALTPDEALEILRAAENRAVPAYTTSSGWLGYGEEKMETLLRETLSKGYKHPKFKVGGDLGRDRLRLSIARKVIGYDIGNVLKVDANQVWSVPQAIA
ncbi:MAG: L-galactonate dehydratase [Sporothrix epigloea]